ncbi:MAG: hypothetical protein LBC75_10600 [Fibromonadaceae bacterium]|jgi:hypothetical protein|nr:hypothetical protein [Fibromonadaceae bacterium]
MKKLKIIFLICILASITSCYCDDCSSSSDEKYPAFSNKSGGTVKIVGIAEDIEDFPYPMYYEKLIANGEILYTKPSEEWNVLFVTVCEDCFEKPIRIEFHFLEDSLKCLIFDGPVKHDGIDPRSWEPYKKGKRLSGFSVRADFIAYVYTITSEHKAMAKEDYCP